MGREHVGRFLTITYTWARRCAVALIGGTVVFIGILMIVFPGPAFIVIPAGLAILGIEFACARRWLRKVRTTGTQVIGRTRSWLRPRSQHEKHDDYRKHADRNVRASPYLPQRAATARHHSSPHRATASTKTSYFRVP
jgi:hypothetical protein